MDGRINTMPDPVKDAVMKPWVDGIEEVDRAIETVYVKAYDNTVDKKYLQVCQHGVLWYCGTMIVLDE